MGCEREKRKDLLNKEKDLLNKEKELYQNKISELNKVYVDSINQIYNRSSFIAGSYSLNSLILNWRSLYNDDNKEEVSIKISQLSGILFLLTKMMDIKMITYTIH